MDSDLKDEPLPAPAEKPALPRDDRRIVRRVLKTLAWIVGIVVVLVASLAIFIAVFDWNGARPWVAARLSKAMHRTVTIEGDLNVAWHRDTTGRHHDWLPRPRVSVGKLTIGNADWAKAPTFATFDEVAFDVPLVPLLGHQVQLRSTRVVHPLINLQRDAQGRKNWTFGQQDETHSGWTVQPGNVALDRGRLTVSDAIRKLDIDFEIEPLNEAIDFDEIVRQQEKKSRLQAAKEVGAAGAQKVAKSVDRKEIGGRRSGQRYAFSWKGTGSISGAKIEATGKVGGVLALQDDDDPWPLQADARIGTTHVALVGTLTNPSSLEALDLRLWLSGESLADLYPIARVTLPETPRFVSEGRLIGDLKKDGNVFRYEDFKGRVGESDLSGTLKYDKRRERPLLSGNVDSTLLQFSDLGPVVGADQTRGQARADAEHPAGKALPAEPFRTDRWRAMDADVHFTGKQLVHTMELPIHDVDTHIVLDNGLLTLKPTTFAIAGGDAKSELEFDGRQAPLKGKFDITLRHIKLKELLPAFDPMKTSLGEVNGDVALTATGNSIAGLLGGTDGEIKLLLNDGAISKALVEEAGLNVMNIVITKLFGDRQIKINCAASHFVVAKGVLDSQLFMIDTEDALIDVDGTIDLGNETLDLTVHPDAKSTRVLSLRSPIHVRGTFKKPDIAIDKRTLLLRGGGAVALGALAPIAALIPLIAPSENDENNHCAGIVERMRGASKAPKQK